MRKVIRPEIHKYRIRKGLFKSGDSLGYTGAFFIPMQGTEHAGLSLVTMKVIAGENYKGWDHVSVSLQTRTPTWEETCYIKDLFFDVEELVIQLHPPKSKYKNKLAYCLHLWKSPQNIDLPPEETV